MIEPRLLSTLSEETASRVASAMAGNENETDMSMNSGGSDSDKVAATIADLEEAIMIVEEEMTPYLGRKLSWERLNTMVARVEELRKTLCKGHLFLVKEKAPEYTTELRDIVAVHKRVLTDLMIYFFGVWDEKTKRAANRGLLKGCPSSPTSPTPSLSLSLRKSSSFTRRLQPC